VGDGRGRCGSGNPDRPVNLDKREIDRGHGRCLARTRALLVLERAWRAWGLPYLSQAVIRDGRRERQLHAPPCPSMNLARTGSSR
jgi:hypothetical protein